VQKKKRLFIHLWWIRLFFLEYRLLQGCQSHLVKNGTKKGKKLKNGLKID